MNTQLSKESKRSNEEVLRFDHEDEDKIAYFRLGGNWEDASEYPQILPLKEYSKEDLLRLAWDILRRSPRYRHQHKRLQEFGIKRSTFSGYEGESYFSNTDRPEFNGWQDISLAGDKCIPAKSSINQRFGEYVEQLRAGEAWFVMNRRKWVLDLWGLKYLPNPNTNYLTLKKRELLIAPAGAILVENSDVSF